MTEQLILFDYAALDSETRIVVQQRTSEIKALMKRAASDIIEIGQKLIEVRSKLGHGHFEGWIKSEFDWTRQTAYRFINVADHFSGCNNLLQMAPSALYLLAAPSTPDSARQEAIARAEQGESITHATARTIVDAAKVEAEIEARRYDGWPQDTPPEDDEPLTPYEQQIAAQYERSQPATEYVPALMSQPMSVLTSQGTVEWYTPPDLIQRARKVLGGIDLDPASNDIAQQWIRATEYYTADDDGKAQTWRGRVWLNPPFDEAGDWVDLLDSQYVNGDVDAAILLVNSAPGYNWWEDLWRRRPVCMLRERVRFYTAEGIAAEGAAKKGTTIAYYGNDLDAFAAAFGDLGRIILPSD